MQTQMYSSEELKIRYNSDTRLSQIIDDFEKDFWESGKVICEIHLNGDYLAEENEGVLAQKTLVDITSLEIITRDQMELIEVTLRTIHQWVPKLRTRSLELNQALKGDIQEPPIEDFIELIDGCKWLSDSLCLLRPTLVKIAKDDVFSEQWTRVELFFTAVAQEVLKAYENKDMVLLCDILEYDLTSALDQWQKLLFEQEDIRSLANV